MRIRKIMVLLAGCLSGTLALADTARHTTVNLDASGKVTDVTEMVADDNRNMRMEMYRADGGGNRGALDSYIVFNAAEQKMLTFTDGMCQVLDLTGEELPGGVSREEVSAAQMEMQRALEQMRKENPEMAKMLEAQMGSSMAAIMGGEPPTIDIIQTGQERTIAGYDTTSFQVTGLPMAGDYVVWAADVDDVEGGRTMALASQAMMQAHRQMMENMGIGEIFGANAFGEIVEAMKDYYPIESGDGAMTTRLTSTDGNGTEDFGTTCPAQ